MTTSRPSSSEQYVFMSKGPERITQLGSSLKGASVSAYRGAVILHLRRYFGESNLKFPTKTGLTLNRQEFEHLLSIRDDLLAEFDRLQSVLDRKTSTSKITTTPPVANTTVAGTAAVDDGEATLPVPDDDDAAAADDDGYYGTGGFELYVEPNQPFITNHNNNNSDRRDPRASNSMTNIPDKLTGMNYTPSNTPDPIDGTNYTPDPDAAVNYNNRCIRTGLPFYYDVEVLPQPLSPEPRKPDTRKREARKHPVKKRKLPF